MREIRIHVDTPLAANSELTLPPEAAHHVVRVLRLKPGQTLTLFDGRGGQYPATIESINGKTVTVTLGEHDAVERESPLTITLVQAISRGRQMDYTLQKAVELGVNRIIPVLSEFGQVKIEAKRLPGKLEHWRGVIASACEQCGRNRLPELASPLALRDWLDNDQTKALCLLLDTRGGRHLRELPAPEAAIQMIAGPEGGFSQAEYDSARAAGCISIDLGPRVLRTETAAPAALTACQALWGDLG